MKAPQRAARRRAGDRGFSTVELIAAIVIMAALIAILVPQFAGHIERNYVAADDAAADELLNAVQTIAGDEKYAHWLAKGNGAETYSTPIAFLHKDVPDWLNSNNTVLVNDCQITSATAANPTLSNAASAIRAGLTQYLGDDWPIKYNVKSNTHMGQTYTVTLTYAKSAGSAGDTYIVSGEWK
jgi:type II secretory pathway pseudopilin PulG